MLKIQSLVPSGTSRALAQDVVCSFKEGDWEEDQTVPVRLGSEVNVM